MSLDENIRQIHARTSLAGLSVGDAFGEFFFSAANSHYLTSKSVPTTHWDFTDDTNMALSIVEILRKHKKIDQDALAASFAKHFDHSRGYGPAMYHLLPQLFRGRPWREVSKELFAGQGSFGNGSAMRVAPLGAYFADDLELVIENAKLSAEVTHSHPEAIAGAIAVAVAAAWAWQLRVAKPTRGEFINYVLQSVPDSEVRSKCVLARDLQSSSILAAIGTLGNGSGILCQDTVPYTLWCAGEYLDNYEEALWLTASGGGDIDTNCAIVGGIVVMCAGEDSIPAKWLRNREALPVWPFEDEKG